MTDDEREAREWLKHLQIPGATSAAWADNASTILRLLDRPVLPRGEDVSAQTIKAMLDAVGNATRPVTDGMRAAIDVLHEHLTAPPVKKAEVWTIRLKDGRFHGVYQTEEEAALVGNQFFFGSRIVKLIEAADDDQ